MAKFVAILMLSLAVVNAQTSTKQCKGEKFSNKKLLLKVGEDHSIILRRKKSNLSVSGIIMIIINCKVCCVEYLI